jgi:hypothetical protein
VFSEPEQVEVIGASFEGVAGQLGGARGSGYTIEAVWRDLEGGLICGQRVGVSASLEQQVA